jgi:hypothetical protein
MIRDRWHTASGVHMISADAQTHWPKTADFIFEIRGQNRYG